MGLPLITAVALGVAASTAATPVGEPTSAVQPAPANSDAVTQRPEARLARDFVRSVAATLPTVAIVADPSVSVDEYQRIVEAINRAGLVQITSQEIAAAVLRLHRSDEATLTATAVATSGGANDSGRIVWSGTVAWPGDRGTKSVAAQAASSGSAGSESTSWEPGRDERVTSESVVRYRQLRLSIEQVLRWQWPVASLFGEPPVPSHARIDQPWGGPFSSPSMSPETSHDWTVMRGGSEPIGELELARLLGDDLLKQRIEESQASQRLRWGISLGSLAAASSGAGAWLYFSNSDRSGTRGRDLRGGGVSLLVLGATSAVLAVVLGTMEVGHVLLPSDVDVLVNTYNERLRRELGISQADVATHRDDNSAPKDLPQPSRPAD